MLGSIIYGTTDFSELLIANLLADPAACKPVAVTVDREYLADQKSFMGLPLIPADKLAEQFPAGQYGVYVTVGYKNMNLGRQNVFAQLQGWGYEILSYQHPTAQILAMSSGIGLIALQHTVIDRFCQIGEGNILQIGVIICHHATVGNFNFFGPGATVAGQVHIGSNCFLGANCTIRNGVTLGDRTLVGAGAYVDHDTAPGSVVLPAASMTLSDRDSSKIEL